MTDKVDTICVHGAGAYINPTGAINTPIYQCATFKHPALNETTGYDYARQQNPTREELERTIAKLESGKEGFAFSTGMAAISALFSIFSPGDHIIATDDLYGGTYRIFEIYFKKYGIDVTYVDTRDIKSVEANIRKETKAIYLETPSNPMMKISDIRKLAEIAKNHSLLTVVDNTFLSPYFQRPIELGADVVVHSGTKYLGGHNDTLAGFVISNIGEISEKIRLIQKSTGGVLGAFDSWLILRGIKTLGIRLDRQQENAMKIAEWLKTNKYVEKVYYAGLPEHENHDILKRDAYGFGAMISFSVTGRDVVERVLKKVKIISFAESLGGVESLITYPMVQTHADVPFDVRDRLGVTEKLLRFSVGIENIEDLIKDLEQAMEV